MGNTDRYPGSTAPLSIVTGKLSEHRLSRLNAEDPRPPGREVGSCDSTLGKGMEAGMAFLENRADFEDARKPLKKQTNK